MKLSTQERKVIVEALMLRLEALFDNYEQTGHGVTYLTMVREDWGKAFGAMLTLDAPRVAALKIQMALDSSFSDEPFNFDSSEVLLQEDPDPEMN